MSRKSSRSSTASNDVDDHSNSSLDALISNINCGIDDLYQRCEAELDKDMCQDAMSLLDRSGRDFKLLIERIDNQRKFGLNHGSGAGWEHTFDGGGGVPEGSFFNRSMGLGLISSIPIGINNDRSVDAAYASYINPSLTRGLIGAVSNIDMGPLLRDKNLMPVAKGINDSGSNCNSCPNRDSDQSPMKVQTQTPPRNSTLRAAAAPFQPATLAMQSYPESVDSISSINDISMNMLAPAADPFVLNSPAVVSNLTPVDVIPPNLDIKENKRKVMAVIGKQLSARQSQPKQQPQQLQLVRGTMSTSSSTSTSFFGSSKSTGARSRTNSVVCNIGMKNAGASHNANLSQAYVMSKRDVVDTSSYDLLNCSFSSSERKRNSEKGREEWEAAMEAEVSEASEHVWRQVENWIEAEAMAEEAAWDVLVLGHDNDADENDNEDEERYMGDEIDCLDVDMGGKLTDPDSDIDSAPAPTSGSTAMHSTGMGTLLAGDGICSSGEDLFSFVSQGLSASNSAISLSTATSAASSPTASNKIQSARNSPSPRSGSPVNSSSCCPVGVSRILHAKLSSPDRRRALSPSEAKKRQEARQQSAESTRDKNVAERRLKALQVSDRVKMRSMNERNRLALAEQALEDRLRDAEKRHEECIKIIRVRAGNENTKVSEVMFINNMNAEGIVDQLRQKLVEVEARVLAAAERRQDILTGITVRQRKRNSRKVQQMSELRLHLERQKMERWDKLQRRLEAVQTRRQARFLEMQRRSDAQELTRARLLLAALAMGKDKDDRSICTDIGSGTAINTTSIPPVPPVMGASDTSCTQSLVSKIVKFKSQLIPPPTDLNLNIGDSISTVDDLKVSKNSIESISSSIMASGGTSGMKPKEKAASNQSTGISLPSTSYSRSRQLINSSSNLSIDITTTKSSLNGTSNHPSLTSLSISSSSRRNRKGGSYTNIPLLSRSPVGSCKPSPSLSFSSGFNDQSSSSAIVQLTSATVGGIRQTAAGPIVNNKRNLKGEVDETGSQVSQQAKSMPIDTITLGQALSLSQSVGEGDGEDNETKSKRSPRAAKISSTSTSTSTSSPAEQIHTTHVDEASKAKELDSTPGSPAETNTYDNGAGGDGVPLSRKKKKRCKKKVCGEVKDEEMILLDALLSAKEQLLHISGNSGDKYQKEKSSSEIDIPMGKVANGTYSVEFGSEASDVFHHLTRRPQLMKHVFSFIKSIKKKKSVKTALDQAVGIRSICYDVSTLKAERVMIALSHIYSLYLPTAKRRDSSYTFDATKEAECRTIDLSVPTNVSIHSLMTLLCGDSDLSTLSLTSPSFDSYTSSHDATTANKMLQKKTALTSAVCAVLSRLESVTGDQRKETGLFIKHGGIYLLRVLFGTEVGVMALGDSSRLCGAEDVVRSGLLMRMSKAVCACSTTAIARHALFSTGLALLLSDIIGGAASHLTDWLNSSWCNNNYNNCNRSSRGCGTYDGGKREVNNSTIWPEECQVLPLLLSALTRLLKHATTISTIATSSVLMTSPAMQEESHNQMEGWLKYLFASGCVSALCKSVKALQPHLYSLSTEALPHILLCSLLEVIGGISGCLRSCHQREIALGVMVDAGSGPGRERWRGREGILDTTSDNLSSTSLLPAVPSDITQNDIVVVPPSTVIIDQKSQHILRQKDMVSMIKDLHLVPVLAQMLHRFLVESLDNESRSILANTVPKIKEPISATDSGLENGTSSLRTAPIYCITGLLVEILRELALLDSSLIQCLRPPLLSAAAATAATITAATVATATTTVPGAVKSKNDENSVINLSEERTGIEYSSSHLPVPITAPKISNSKHNEGSPQIDTDADSEASLSIECMMVESSQLLLESLMTLMDTPVNSSKEIEKDGISLVTLPSTVPGAGVVTKIVRKTSTSEVSLNPSQLATCYTLKSSSINSSCHVDQNISDSKSMELFFRPLDADNSVRHLLSLIGFIYSQSLADTIITEKYSDGQLIVENMIKERKESEEVRTEVDDTVEAVKEELKRSEEKEEKRILEGLLRALLCLPKRYYTEERFKMQLLPTLQLVYEGREDELKEKLFRITSQ